MKLTFSICTSTLVFAACLHAGSLAPACVTDTLANYDSEFGGDSGAQCSIGILNYGNFSFSSSGTGANEGDGDIKVTPVTDGNSIGGGFMFSLEPIPGVPLAPSFFVPFGDIANYYIDYHFDIDPGPIASGTDLEMDPPFGNVTITQTFCLDSQFAFIEGENGGVVCRNQSFEDQSFSTSQTLNPQPQSFSVDDTNPPLTWTNHLDFNPPAQNFGNVMTHINIDATNTPGGSGFDAAGSNLTVGTPEPSSVLLLLAGISGLCVRRRFMSNT